MKRHAAPGQAGTRSQLAVRLIYLSRAVDRAFRLFDALRSRVVLALASESTLEAYNDFVYGRAPEYQTDAALFRRGFFQWEEQVVGRLFPPPPARVLVGGAGGGREVFALAERGYEVVAFEPSAALAKRLEDANARAGSGASVFLGRYTAMTTLQPIGGGATVRIEALGPFDAVVFGWCSFSHIRTHAERVGSLRAMAAVSDGPILMSFFPAPNGVARDAFSSGVGYFRQTDETEARALAAEAGLDVLELSMDELDGRWPHIVMRRPR